MADRRNEARALRILEIANDFRILEQHNNSLLTRPGADPPDPASRNLIGYQLLSQLRTQFAGRNRDLLPFDPGQIANLGRDGDGNEEARKTQLQRITLDISARRFVAHKIYLKAAAAMRWVQGRQQILQGPESRRAEAMRALDQRLSQEVETVTDQHVYSNLRQTSQREGNWIDEDPSLERILAWIRSQT